MIDPSIAFFFAQPEPSAASDMDIWVPVVSALLASALTGTMGLLLARHRQSFDQKAEQLRFMRSKLEETHEVGRSLLVAFLGVHRHLSMVIATHADPQAIEVVNKLEKVAVSEGGTPKLRMLVEFYCPELLPKLVTVHTLVE